MNTARSASANFADAAHRGERRKMPDAEMLRLSLETREFFRELARLDAVRLVGWGKRPARVTPPDDDNRRFWEDYGAANSWRERREVRWKLMLGDEGSQR